MRRLFAALFLASVLTLPHKAQAGGSATNAAARCPPAHAHVLLANAQAVIYVRGSHEERTTFGCLRGAGGAHEIGQPEYCEGGSVGFCAGISKLRLTGTNVAYEEGGLSEADEKVTSSAYVVAVRSVRSGRIIHRAPTGAMKVPRKGFTGVGPVTALVLGAEGSVAWIVDNRERSKPGLEYYEVHAIDRHGRHVLAAGTTIERSSLRLRGHKLSWLLVDGEKTAVLQ